MSPLLEQVIFFIPGGICYLQLLLTSHPYTPVASFGTCTLHSDVAFRTREVTVRAQIVLDSMVKMLIT